MAPQPVSFYRRKKIVIWASHESIERRPGLAPYIARVIAKWGHIEGNICSILAYLLAAEATPTMAMLQSLRSSSAQFDMIEAAAKTKITDETEIEMFQAVMLVARKGAQRRHQVAHHIWAHSDQLPNALILIDPAAYADIFVRLQEVPTPSGIVEDESFGQPDSRRCFIYRKNEFEEILTHFQVISRSTTFLIRYIQPDRRSKDRAYGWLTGEPMIQEAVKAIRAARPKPKSPRLRGR
jgi:hypothetical protein